VVETRQSGHLGDWFHGIGPTTPEQGEIILLGEGAFFSEKSEDLGCLQVGLRPADKRQEFWLDPKALYRAHDQTVELYFEEEAQ
jgi:hypothetical protein